MRLLNDAFGVLSILVLVIEAKFIFRFAIWSLVVLEPGPDLFKLTGELSAKVLKC